MKTVLETGRVETGRPMESPMVKLCPMTQPAVQHDIWSYQSWHRVGAWRNTLESAKFWRELVRAAFGGAELEKQAREIAFTPKVLEVAREKMGFPPFQDHSPWLAPDQDWVSNLLAEFVTWYGAWLKSEREKNSKEESAQ